MDAPGLRTGDTALVSLFAALGPEGLDPAPVLRLAHGARRIALVDLGPALAAAGLAYATPRARHAATRLLAALAAGSGAELTLPPPDAQAAALGAEACGVAPLPALVLAGPPRVLSRAALLGIPPDLLPAARVMLLGHGHLPAWLALAAPDRAAIERTLPRATSLAHAAALAGRLPPIQALDTAARAAADAFIFGEDFAPAFLPEPIAAALTPGADAAAIAAMAAALAPLLAEPPFCPAPLAALPRPRRARAPTPPAADLFGEAPAATQNRRLRAVS